MSKGDKHEDWRTAEWGERWRERERERERAERIWNEQEQQLIENEVRDRMAIQTVKWRRLELSAHHPTEWELNVFDS